MREYTIRADDGSTTTATEEQLYKAFNKITWSLLLKDYTDAELRPYHEDMAIIATSECLKAMRSYKPTGSVYAYAKTTARHKLGKEAERIRKYNNKIEPLTTEMEERLSQTIYLPEVPSELEHWIARLRELLEPDELQIVRLTLDGLSDKEIRIALYGKSKQGITLAPIWRRIRAKAEAMGGPYKGGAQTTKGGEKSMVKINKLKGLMAENGDTQESLAKKLGVTKQLINLKLTGKSKFSIEMLSQVAKLYNVELSTLVE